MISTGLIFEAKWSKMHLMNRFRLYIFFILVTSFLAAGCKKNVSINEKQAILFQVDFVNYAWGYQHTGLLVDNKGNILTYNNPSDWNFPDTDFNLTEDQVKENIGYCTDTGKPVPPEELQKYAGYIKNISSSKVSALKNVSADAGTTQYICYQFMAKSGKYKGSLMKMEGDLTCENLNFFTKKVTMWLKSLNEGPTKK